jgi:hypothetical protein
MQLERPKLFSQAFLPLELPSSQTFLCILIHHSITAVFNKNLTSPNLRFGRFETHLSVRGNRLTFTSLGSRRLPMIFVKILTCTGIAVELQASNRIKNAKRRKPQEKGVFEDR